MQPNPAPLFLFPPRPAGCRGKSKVSPSGSVVVAASFAPAELTVVLLLGKLASLRVFGVAIASRFHLPRSRFFPQSLTAPRRRRLCLPWILCCQSCRSFCPLFGGVNSGSLELLCFRLGVLAIFCTRWNRFLTSGCFVAAVPPPACAYAYANSSINVYANSSINV